MILPVFNRIEVCVAMFECLKFSMSCREVCLIFELLNVHTDSQQLHIL